MCQIVAEPKLPQVACSPAHGWCAQESTQEPRAARPPWAAHLTARGTCQSARGQVQAWPPQASDRLPVWQVQAQRRRTASWRASQQALSVACCEGMHQATRQTNHFVSCFCNVAPLSSCKVDALKELMVSV